MRSTQDTERRTAEQVTEQHGHSGPAVPRMVLGARLGELRRAQYISRQQAAEAIRTTDTRLARMERGRVGARPRDVADLLTIYGVTDEIERATLLALTEQANVPGWWNSYRDLVPDWFDTYLGLEQAAEVIRVYEAQFVPGLLQTPEYARAVIGLGHRDVSATQVERRVDLRMRRQRVLRGPRPPHLWAVLDEAVLRRPVGGEAVMRAQIEYLIEMCAVPHVALQVLPFDRGAHVSAGGPISMLRLPVRGVPDVVYLEHLFSAEYPEEREDIDSYRRVIDQLVTLAEPVSATPSVLTRILREEYETVPSAG